MYLYKKRNSKITFQPLTNESNPQSIILGSIRCGVAVNTSDYQSREPVFESTCSRFEALVILFSPRCHSFQLVLARDIGGSVNYVFAQ